MRGLRKKNTVSSYEDRIPTDVPTEDELDPSLVHPLYSTFAGLSEDEIDDILYERDTKSYGPAARQLGAAMGHHSHHFKESACNAAVDNAPCASFAEFMADKDPTGGEIKIPCGTCVSLDTKDGSTYVFPEGLNIVGKLHIPNDAKVTIRTRYLLVQGLLRADPPSEGHVLPRSDGSKVTVQLKPTVHGKQ